MSGPADVSIQGLVYKYCIAESTVFAYTDHPYPVISVQEPFSKEQVKVKPVNQNDNETFPCV